MAQFRERNSFIHGGFDRFQIHRQKLQSILHYSKHILIPIFHEMPGTNGVKKMIETLNWKSRFHKSAEWTNERNLHNDPHYSELNQEPSNDMQMDGF